NGSTFGPKTTAGRKRLPRRLHWTQPDRAGFQENACRARLDGVTREGLHDPKTHHSFSVAQTLLPGRAGPGGRRGPLGVLDHARRNGAALGARPPVFARLPGPRFCPRPPLAPPHTVDLRHRAGKLVGRAAAGGGHFPAAHRRLLLLPLAGRHFTLAVPRRARADPGWLAGLALVLAGHRLPAVHDPHAVSLFSDAGWAAAELRHRLQHLLPADARPAGRGRGERHSAQRD